jgi:hypothetical protein
VNESGGLTTSPLDRLIFALSITDCAGRSQGRGKGDHSPKLQPASTRADGASAGRSRTLWALDPFNYDSRQNWFGRPPSPNGTRHFPRTSSPRIW